MTLIPNINNQSIAILSDIEQWKKDIAAAINTKGGDSTGDESFQQLAEDIQTLPYAGISAEGFVQTEEFIFLKYLCQKNSYIKKIKDNSIEYINKDYVLSYNEDLLEIEMLKLENITDAPYCLTHNTVLKKINAPILKEIRTNFAFSYNTNLKEILMPSLIRWQGGTAGGSAFALVSTPNLENIVLGTLVSIEGFYGSLIKLRNITIGQDTNINLNFNAWVATDVINEGQTGIDELNSNLYNNLLTKLYDHSSDGQTRTLRLGWLAYVTPENIAYANAKGWTLTT